MHHSTRLVQNQEESSKAPQGLPTIAAIRHQPESSAPELPDSTMLCCYQNHSPKIQVIRSVDDQHQQVHWHLERVIFPGQRLIFEAPHQSQIYVYTSDPAGMLVDDTLACDRIQVHER